MKKRKAGYKNSSVASFYVMEAETKNGNLARAAEAKKNLERLGYHVEFIPNKQKGDSNRWNQELTEAEHEQAVKKCKDCKWWAIKENQIWGECHKHPPVLVRVHTEPIDSGFEFPQVGESQWCGEFKVRE